MRVSAEDRKLSRRESEVLAILCLGLTDVQTAARLGIAMGTIRVYRKRVESKLNTKGLIQSALVAWKLGLLDLDAIAEEVAVSSGFELAGRESAPE